jgi:hypothetical protein
LQFSLRGILFGIALVGVGFAFARHVQNRREQAMSEPHVSYGQQSSGNHVTCWVTASGNSSHQLDVDFRRTIDRVVARFELMASRSPSYCRDFHLEIRGARLSAETLTPLKRLGGVRLFLDLDVRTVDEDSMECLVGISSLTCLTIRSTPIAGSLVASVSKLDSLEELDLREARIAESAVEELRRSLPACRIVSK